MKKTSTTVRRIICLLLCISMLPLVKVSAASYTDAYQALIKWAKKGDYVDGTGENGREIKLYWNKDLNNPLFDVTYLDYLDSDAEDTVIVSIMDEATDRSYHMTLMELYPGSKDDNYIKFSMFCESERKDGTIDSNGNYWAEAIARVKRNQPLDSGFDMYECDTAISKSQVQKDFKKDVRNVVEFADKIIRENSTASIQDIFSKATPQSIHTAGETWIEKAETCTQDGSMGITCSVCGAKYYETIKAGHKWEITEIITPVTEVHGYGHYTCSRCGETKDEDICISSAFTDMPDKDNWAHAGIDWAVYNNITNGISATSFGPNIGCSRAQVVTFLWRAAGSPAPHAGTGSVFTDVVPGAYYEPAVAWAVEAGITNGMTATTFGPNIKCNRGQIVTFLWRFKGMPAPESAQTPFKDLKMGGYYLDAVAWAVEYGITNGTSKTEFSPASTCSRAQVVTFLYRTEKASAMPTVLRNIVGISLPSENPERWDREGKHIGDFLRAHGHDYETPVVSGSSEIQKNQIEEMIMKGDKVIIVDPIDAEDLKATLKKARRAGIKVISYDCPSLDVGAMDYLLTFAPFEVGVEQGNYIVDQLDLSNAGDRTYNIEIIGGAPDSGSDYICYDGAMSVLSPYIEAGTLNVVSGQIMYEEVATWGSSSVDARDRFKKLLTQYYSDKPLHAVMASNDYTAQGVAIALKDVYRNDIYPVVTGQGCDIVSVHNMIDGVQAMSVFKEPKKFATMAAAMAASILTGGDPKEQDSYFNGTTTIEVPTVLCPPSVCTADTIKSDLIDSGIYTEEEVYPSWRQTDDGR